MDDGLGEGVREGEMVVFWVVAVRRGVRQGVLDCFVGGEEGSCCFIVGFHSSFRPDEREKTYNLVSWREPRSKPPGKVLHRGRSGALLPSPHPCRACGNRAIGCGF